MAITADEVAGVLSAGGYNAASFAAVMGRLAALDVVTKLRAERALLVLARDAAVAEADEAIRAKDAAIAAAQAAADAALGGA